MKCKVFLGALGFLTLAGCVETLDYGEVQMARAVCKEYGMEAMVKKTPTNQIWWIHCRDPRGVTWELSQLESSND